MSRLNKKKTLRGDTLVEVMFAVGIFAMVAISLATTMNDMLGKSQSAIEIVMARSEIDAQAEALRFIENSRKNSTMQEVWEQIEANARDSLNAGDLLENVTSCPDVPDYAFYIDTFHLDSGNSDDIYIPKNRGGVDYIQTASTFPRILHNSGDTILHDYFGENEANSRSEGVWIIAERIMAGGRVDAYEFYVQTCWNPVGESAVASTISSVVRIRNPEPVSVAPAAACPGGTSEVTLKYKDSSDNDKEITTQGCTGAIAYSSSPVRPMDAKATLSGWSCGGVSPCPLPIRYPTTAGSTLTLNATYSAAVCTSNVIFKDKSGNQLATRTETCNSNVNTSGITAPTIVGHSHIGWNTSSTATSTATVRAPASSGATATYYAVYSPIRYYYYLFYSNSGYKYQEAMSQNASISTSIVSGKRQDSVTFNNDYTNRGDAPNNRQLKVYFCTEDKGSTIRTDQTGCQEYTSSSFKSNPQCSNTYIWPGWPVYKQNWVVSITATIDSAGNVTWSGAGSRCDD